MCIVRGLLDEKLIQAGFFQFVRLADVRREFLRRNIVKHDLQRFVRLKAADDEIHRAPKRFQRLKVRMVQDGSHGAPERFIHRGEHRILPRILCGDDIGCDHLLQEILDRCLRFRLVARAPDEAAEIRELCIHRDHRAAGRAGSGGNRWHGNFSGPRLEFGGGLGKGRGGLQPLPQPGQLAENIEIRVKLLGMEVVHRSDVQFHRAAIGTDGKGELDLQAGDGGIEIVAVHAQRFPLGEFGTRLEPAEIRTAREIAQQRNPEFLRTGARGPRRRVFYNSEIKLIVHGEGGWVCSVVISMKGTGSQFMAGGIFPISLIESEKMSLLG